VLEWGTIPCTCCRGLDGVRLEFVVRPPQEAGPGPGSGRPNARCSTGRGRSPVRRRRSTAGGPPTTRGYVPRCSGLIPAAVEAAFKRSAEIDARRVNVTVVGREGDPQRHRALVGRTSGGGTRRLAAPEPMSTPGSRSVTQGRGYRRRIVTAT
jgi:hypothetical protein